MKRILLIMVFVALVGCAQKKEDCGRYSIGRDPTWYPLQIGLQATNLNAFTNSLVQEIGIIEGIPLQIHDIDWGQLVQALDNREVGGIFSSISPTVISQEKYLFSEPFFQLGPVLVVSSQSNAKSLTDLAGKIVLVNQYDESVLIAEKVPTIIIESYQSMPVALEVLASGKVDGLLMPIMEAQTLISHLYPSQLKIVTPPLNDQAIRLLTLKEDNQSLFQHFAHGLKRIRTSGQYESLRNAYLSRLLQYKSQSASGRSV